MNLISFTRLKVTITVDKDILNIIQNYRFMVNLFINFVIFTCLKLAFTVAKDLL